MSRTSYNLSNQEWLRRLVSGEPHQVIGGSNDPYMLRWYVIPRNALLNVYVHKFLRSDDDRALHDHPWWFVSWLLKGRYLEYTEVTPNPHERKRFSLAYRRAQHRHRVALVNGFNADGTYGPQPTWTIIVTGRRVRMWGFWCPRERFIPWEQFVDSDAGCGEFHA